MPCYKCGKTFNEPTQLCVGCNLHLVKNGSKCTTIIMCSNDYNTKCKGCDRCKIICKKCTNSMSVGSTTCNVCNNKLTADAKKWCINDNATKCEGCKQCQIYPGCDTVASVVEPPIDTGYNYPLCYCNCAYEALRSTNKEVIKPNVYYAICHGCCPIYEQTYHTSTWLSEEPSRGGVSLRHRCHMPTSKKFKYDRLYEELKELDILEGKLASRMSDKKLAKRNADYHAKRAAEKAERMEREMEQRRDTLTLHNTNRSDARSNFGILRNR